MNDPIRTLTLPESMIQVILEVFTRASIPWMQSNPVIVSINGQVAVQQQADAKEAARAKLPATEAPAAAAPAPANKPGRKAKPAEPPAAPSPMAQAVSAVLNGAGEAQPIATL